MTRCGRGGALPSGLVGVIATFGLVLGLGATVNAVFAFGEEFGWRGCLPWELAPWGFWKASFTTGALWGVWHAPVIVAGDNYPSYPVVGVVSMTIACLSFSPVYTYLVVRTESVLPAGLLHGVFNGSASIVVAYAITENAALSELVASPVGVAGVFAFGLAAIGIVLAGPPSLIGSALSLDGHRLLRFGAWLDLIFSDREPLYQEIAGGEKLVGIGSFAEVNGSCSADAKLRWPASTRGIDTTAARWR